LPLVSSPSGKRERGREGERERGREGERERGREGERERGREGERAQKDTQRYRSSHDAEGVAGQEEVAEIDERR
jgi:hypothetical protein